MEDYEWLHDLLVHTVQHTTRAPQRCHARVVPLPVRPLVKPALRQVWRDPATLQLGLEPRRAVVLSGLQPIDSHVLNLLDGSRGEAVDRARRFAAKLAARTGLPVTWVGEALTTVEAHARLREAGVDPRREPGRLDALAAQILLQEALDRP